MKTLFVCSERDARETRVSITPADAKKLADMGWLVNVESGAGAKAGFTDADYEASGAKIADADFIKEADFVVAVRKPEIEDVAKLKKGAFRISLLDPFNEKALIKAFADAGITAASFEMIPRTTIAQKMDVLSSQSNLAGYSAVITAAARLTATSSLTLTATTCAGTTRRRASP